MTEAITNSGGKVAICSTPQPTALDVTEFGNLSYVDIGKVGQLGERGANTNILTYDTWDTDVALKGKGITNAGDPVLECAYDSADPGQAALRAAAEDKSGNYAFKVTRQDGSVQYLRGLVTGPVEPGGRNEDFVIHNFTIALNQLPIDVPAGS